MIKVENLRVGYDKRIVIENISLTIPNNGSLSIIGPNGCGKTTLLKSLAGLLPYSGEIFINDTNIKSLSSKILATKIGLLSQTTSIFFNHTVWDTVMMGRYVHQGSFGLSKAADKKIVEEALEKTGIIGIKNSEISALSGGQLQRVFIAKLIAQDPEIILLDEPTNHLDICFQVELINFIKAWAKEKNKIVIGVLHDINLAMLLSNNMILMENGKIIKQGNSSKVCSSVSLEKAYNMDVKGFMLNSLKKWEDICNDEKKIYSVI